MTTYSTDKEQKEVVGGGDKTTAWGTIGGGDPSEIAAVDAIASALKERTSKPLTNEDFYPAANQPIEFGVTSGSLIGSSPIYSVGMGMYPWAVESRKADEENLLKTLKHKQEIEGLKFRYAKIKDTVLNTRWPEAQKKIWDELWESTLEKFGGNAAKARKYLNESGEMYFVQSKIDDASNIANDVLPEWDERIAEMKTGRWDEKKGKVVDSYSDPDIEKERNKVASLITGAGTLEDLKNIKANKYMTMKGVETAADEVADVLNKRIEESAKAQMGPASSGTQLAIFTKAQADFDKDYCVAEAQKLLDDPTGPWASLPPEKRPDAENLGDKIYRKLEPKITKHIATLRNQSSGGAGSKKSTYNYVEAPVALNLGGTFGNQSVVISDAVEVQGAPKDTYTIPWMVDNNGKNEKETQSQFDASGKVIGDTPPALKATFMGWVDAQELYDKTGQKQAWLKTLIDKKKQEKGANAKLKLAKLEGVVFENVSGNIKQDQSSKVFFTDADYVAPKFNLVKQTGSSPSGGSNKSGGGSPAPAQSGTLNGTDKRTYNGKTYTVDELKKAGWSEDKIKKHTK